MARASDEGTRLSPRCRAAAQARHYDRQHDRRHDHHAGIGSGYDIRSR
jgi:hypothetical protein